MPLQLKGSNPNICYLTYGQLVALTISYFSKPLVQIKSYPPNIWHLPTALFIIQSYYPIFKNFSKTLENVTLILTSSFEGYTLIKLSNPDAALVHENYRKYRTRMRILEVWSLTDRPTPYHAQTSPTQGSLIQYLIWNSSYLFHLWYLTQMGMTKLPCCDKVYLWHTSFTNKPHLKALKLVCTRDSNKNEIWPINFDSKYFPLFLI